MTQRSAACSTLALFAAAAAHWEEIFLDVYTVQIAYWWEDVSSPFAGDITDDGAGLLTARARSVQM